MRKVSHCIKLNKTNIINKKVVKIYVIKFESEVFFTLE